MSARTAARPPEPLPRAVRRAPARPTSAGAAALGERRFGAALARAVAVSRPLFWLNSAALCVLAAILAERPPGWRELVLIAFATLPLNLFVYALNDLHDLPSDAANPRKGSLEGARAGAPELRRLVAAALALNAPFLLFFVATAPAPRALVALAALFFVAWAYSAPPLRAKSRPGWDSLANAGYVLPLVFACLYLEVPDPPWLEAAVFATWAVGSHALTSIQDVRADRAAGVRTIATALGRRASAGAAIACYLAAAAAVAVRHPAFAGVLLLYAGIALAVRRSSAAEAPHAAYRGFMALNLGVGFAVVTRVALAHPAATRWAAVVMVALCACSAAGVLVARGNAGRA